MVARSQHPVVEDSSLAARPGSTGIPSVERADTGSESHCNPAGFVPPKPRSAAAGRRSTAAVALRALPSLPN